MYLDGWTDLYYIDEDTQSLNINIQSVIDGDLVLDENPYTKLYFREFGGYARQIVFSKIHPCFGSENKYPKFTPTSLIPKVIKIAVGETNDDSGEFFYVGDPDGGYE